MKVFACAMLFRIVAEYNWSDDSKKCYDLAIKAAREKRVRLGLLAPHTALERIQAEQGPVRVSELDCVRVTVE